jgi:hypothetical protein
MKKFNQEKIECIVYLYKERHSLREVCKQLNISIGSAHKYTSKDNIINKHQIIDELHSKDECLIGLYVGIWMGDGTQYYDRGYTVKICSDKRNVLLNKFIRDIIFRIFGKHTLLVNEIHTNRAYIKCDSKFIFNFIHKYTRYDGNKTYTVNLREDIHAYTKEFLEGCLLGLILTDGYLKHVLSFSVTSPQLANNVKQILKYLKFNPKEYIENRDRYKWKTLYIIKLSPKESRILETYLDEVLERLNCEHSFKELKYEK